MSTPKNNRHKKPVKTVVPIRLPDDVGVKVKELSQSNHLSEQDILRMALVRGLPVLEKLLANPETAAA